MKRFSSSEAAKKLDLDPSTLSRYIKAKKLPAPTIVEVGSASLHLWTEAEIEHVRKLLPKIANGRKTRYQKLGAKQKGTKPKKKSKP